jgi:hypothetical protein
MFKARSKPACSVRASRGLRVIAITIGGDNDAGDLFRPA